MTGTSSFIRYVFTIIYLLNRWNDKQILIIIIVINIYNCDGEPLLGSGSNCVNYFFLALARGSQNRWHLTYFSVNSITKFFLLEDFTKFIEENNFSQEYVDPNIVNRAFASFFVDTKLFGKESHTFNIIFLIFSVGSFIICTTFRYFCFYFGKTSFVHLKSLRGPVSDPWVIGLPSLIYSISITIC